jgi:membrane protease YdiL (CAAX protease family)
VSHRSPAGPDRPEGPQARWGLGEAAVSFVVGVILASLLAGVVQAAVGYRTGRGTPVPLSVNAASLIGLWLGVGGGAVWCSRRRGTGSLARDFGLRLRWPLDVGLGLVAGAGSQYVLVPLLYLPFEQVSHTLRRRLETPAKQDVAGVHGAVAVTVAFVLLALGAPLVEELFFRGLLQRALVRRFGPVPAVAGSAVVFGLAHFELLQLPALILFGVVLGVLAERTGRLGPGIVAHATFNAVTVLSLTLRR